MAELYVPGSMSRLYEKLEDFVKAEVDEQTNQDFRREKPSAPAKLDWKKPEHQPLAREWLRIRDGILGDKVAGHTLNAPPPVFQASLPICWAAATESWLKVTHHPKAMNKEQLRRKFAKDPTGALTIKADPLLKLAGLASKGNELSALMAHFGATCQEMKAGKLTYNYIYEKLQREGHLLVFLGSGSSMGHTLVLYGIFIEESLGRAKVKAMDPLQGGNDTFPLKSIRSLNLVIAWKLHFKVLGGSGSSPTK